MVSKVAIIPARKGSKRIPLKNIVNFHGKPLIAWTIGAALKSKVFDAVYVSTDSQKIANISEKYGAKVPFLRTKYTDDNSSVSSVIIDFLENLKKKKSKEFDVVFSLMPNCPLRTGQDIIRADKNCTAKKASFQLSCFEFGFMNPWWAFTLDKNCRPEYIHKSALKKRSQDLSKLFCPSGAIWIANIKALQKSKTFYGPNHIFYKLGWKNAIDIDSKEDLELAKSFSKN
ncbi:acylneuraminate cytidylyltransferase family protein [Candidatus Beckwithbacteria bacterium]|nr:acylneuraminate cytidylyltransferase family protein [Candidatus Beckwithbacteria bacterium]